MINALTAANRQRKEDVDRISQDFQTPDSNERFPSYFGIFSNFTQFLILQASTSLLPRCLRRKRQFLLITAFMAIV
jgi:hypothetical protein